MGESESKRPTKGIRKCIAYKHTPRGKRCAKYRPLR